MIPASAVPSADLIQAAADRLEAAASTGTPCAPVRDLVGTDDIELAYAVQRELVARRTAAGATVVGRKIGLTAAAVQRQLGVDRPDFGVLLGDMRWAQDTPIPVGRLLQPKVEAEVAFVLAADIDDASADHLSVRPAVAYAVAALEIVDSRIADWDISFGDTVSDNASSGLFVLGTRELGLDEVEPRAVSMSMTVDGVEVSSGSGEACLGDPLSALAWLARTAVALGAPLRAGEVVLSGALGPMAVVPPGAHVAAEIHGLGDVSAIFSAGGPE